MKNSLNIGKDFAVRHIFMPMKRNKLLSEYMQTCL